MLRLRCSSGRWLLAGAREPDRRRCSSNPPAEAVEGTRFKSRGGPRRGPGGRRRSSSGPEPPRRAQHDDWLDDLEARLTRGQGFGQGRATEVYGSTAPLSIIRRPHSSRSRMALAGLEVLFKKDPSRGPHGGSRWPYVARDRVQGEGGSNPDAGEFHRATAERSSAVAATDRLTSPNEVASPAAGATGHRLGRSRGRRRRSPT